MNSDNRVDFLGSMTANAPDFPTTWLNSLSIQLLTVGVFPTLCSRLSVLQTPSQSISHCTLGSKYHPRFSFLRLNLWPKPMGTLTRMSHRHFKLTASRNMNWTSGGEHRPLLAMYFTDYMLSSAKHHWLYFLKKGSKSFMWPVLLLPYGKPQGLKTGKTSASQRPAFTLWFTRNGVAFKTEKSQPTQSTR